MHKYPSRLVFYMGFIVGPDYKVYLDITQSNLTIVFYDPADFTYVVNAKHLPSFGNGQRLSHQYRYTIYIEIGVRTPRS